jgi:AcrR family transcriptional regulator
MPYRRTAQTVRKQAARHQAILTAARAAAAEGGMAAVHVAAIAERAGIATGTVYRYFPSKADLVMAVVRAMAEDQVAAMAKAGRAAPGPLSALAASIATFATHALRQRRLVWAMIADPAEPEAEAARLAYRRALAEEISTRISAAMQAGYLPTQDVALSAAALVGALLEGLIGPLAPGRDDASAGARDAVQALTLLSLRAVGVVDARARGLVVQIALPSAGEA